MLCVHTSSSPSELSTLSQYSFDFKDTIECPITAASISRSLENYCSVAQVLALLQANCFVVSLWHVISFVANKIEQADYHSTTTLYAETFSVVLHITLPRQLSAIYCIA